MKLKMLETVQGAGINGVHSEGFSVNILEKGEVYEISNELADWLLENNKAMEFVSKVPFKEPLEIAEPEVVEITEAEVPAEETPIMTSETVKPKRSRK